MQDLTLLSDDELREVLTDPKQISRFREELARNRIAKRVPPHLLVGKWLDVQGFGPGKVEAFHKVTNSLMYDSHHSIAFAAEQADKSARRGNVKRQVLLRRRKLLRWNNGVRFVMLPERPSSEEVGAPSRGGG